MPFDDARARACTSPLHVCQRRCFVRTLSLEVSNSIQSFRYVHSMHIISVNNTRGRGCFPFSFTHFWQNELWFQIFFGCAVCITQPVACTGIPILPTLLARALICLSAFGPFVPAIRNGYCARSRIAHANARRRFGFHCRQKHTKTKHRWISAAFACVVFLFLFGHIELHVERRMAESSSDQYAVVRDTQQKNKKVWPIHWNAEWRYKNSELSSVISGRFLQLTVVTTNSECFFIFWLVPSLFYYSALSHSLSWIYCRIWRTHLRADTSTRSEHT